MKRRGSSPGCRPTDSTTRSWSTSTTRPSSSIISTRTRRSPSGLLVDAGHLGLDEVDAHRPGRLVELLVALAEGADVHVVDRDVGQRQRARQQHRLLDGVHAADARAVRHAQGLVARAGALDVGDAVGDLAVRGPEDAAVRAVRGEQSLHVQAADDVRWPSRRDTPSWRPARWSRSPWRGRRSARGRVIVVGSWAKSMASVGQAFSHLPQKTQSSMSMQRPSGGWPCRTGCRRRGGRPCMPSNA